MPMSGYRSIAKSIIIAAAMTLSLMVSLPAEGPEPMHDTEWLIETIDDRDVGGEISLAFDSMGNPHIAHRGIGDEDLRYTRWNGSTWNTEIVDSTGRILRGPSLALDSQDYPHIAYQDYSIYELKYARWTGSAWNMEIVDPGCVCGRGISLALDSSETPHISYTGHGEPHVLFYAKRIATNVWAIETPDPSGYMNPSSSIAVDSKDEIHISYHWLDNHSHYPKYARWDGATWNIEIVDDTGHGGWFNALALDSQDRPHISHWDYVNRTLKYAKWNGTEWVNEIIDSEGNVGRHPSIAIDGMDTPHISYHDTDNRDMKYAVWNGTAWSIEVVDTVGWAGLGSSIAFNSTDVPHIAYSDAVIPSLKYAKKVKATLPSEPVITDSILSGPNLEDVTIFWNRSADDGAGRNDVIRYDIRESTTYSGTYTLIESVPADGSLTYGWTCLGCGEGDPSDHFFLIEASDTAHPTPSPNKAGKFTRPLSPGPNLVSIPLIQSDENIETVFQTMKYDRAWFYDSSSQEWKWFTKDKTYSRGLSNLNNTMGVWVNATQDCNLTVAGIVPAQTTIQLYTGWNLVGFPSFNNYYTVADLKAEAGATRVEGYAPTPPYHLRVLEDAEALLAGYGYWVKVDIDVDWIVEVS